MAYIKFHFNIPDEQVREMLVAILSGYDFSGFEEDGNSLYAYTENGQLDENAIKNIAQQYGLDYSKEVVETKNWNEEWEKDFKPVIVGSFCTVRAHFHTMPVNTKFDIVITPKMSFGTGHHATTQLMIAHMEYVDFNGKNVLDFGTGTGVLAILAEKLGAAGVMAIDNNEWSVENTNENIGRNNCYAITARLATLDMIVAEEPYDIILANINRYILLQHMQQMRELLVHGGILVMSGLLKEDEAVIKEAAIDNGLKLKKQAELNNWIMLSFEK